MTMRVQEHDIDKKTLGGGGGGGGAIQQCKW